MTDKLKRNHAESSALKKEVLSIGKHSMIYVAGRALTHAVGFFMIPVYTRFIAPKNYGSMELIGIITGVMALIISMGMADGMARFYYGEKDHTKRDEVVSTVIIGFSTMGLPVILLFLAISTPISSLILEGSQYSYYLQVSIVTVFFGMLCEIGYTYLRMLYMAKLFVAITITQLIIALSLNIWFVVFLKLDILGIFYSTLIHQGLVGSILSLMILKKTGFHVSLKRVWEMIKFGLPLVPSRIGLLLGFVSNRFFLRWMGSADPSVALAQIGLFSLGHKFGVIINRLVNAPFNSFWGPRCLELLLNKSLDSRTTVARVCTYATMCSVYLALILSSGIESVIEIIADPRYRGAHIVVPFVALSYVALGLEKHFTTGILYRKKTKWSTYISVCSLVIVLVWNYLFVPRYGLIGAATSNLAGFAVRVTLIYIVSQRLFPIPFEFRRLVIMFIVAVLLYSVSQAISFPSPYLTFIMRTSIVAFFPVVLFLFKFYHEGELEFARKMLRRASNIVVSYCPGFRQV